MKVLQVKQVEQNGKGDQCMDDEKLKQFANHQTQYATSVKVGAKGQIVIPKEVRELIHIKAGDILLLRADSGLGMAIQPFDMVKDLFARFFDSNDTTT